MTDLSPILHSSLAVSPISTLFSVQLPDFVLFFWIFFVSWPAEKVIFRFSRFYLLYLLNKVTKLRLFFQIRSNMRTRHCPFSNYCTILLLSAAKKIYLTLNVFHLG
jgi:hypothetical protein